MDSGNSWEDGTLSNLMIPASDTTRLAAAVDSLLNDNITLKICLWYHDTRNEIRQLRYLIDPLNRVTLPAGANYREEWTPGPRHISLPLPGSFIAAAADYHSNEEWIYFLLPDKTVVQSSFPLGKAHLNMIMQYNDKAANCMSRCNKPFTRNSRQKDARIRGTI